MTTSHLIAIPADTRCWLQGPIIETEPCQYQGEVRTRHPVTPKNSDLPSVETIAQSLHDTFWYRRTVSTSTAGPITYEFAKRRVILCGDGFPDRAVWLVIKRTLGIGPLYWYYFSNAPLHTRLPTFVWLSEGLWIIEHCFEEAKTALGMHHYEVRKYPGWHHHMLVCLLAHFFRQHLKIRLGEKNSGLNPLSDADINSSGLPVA